MNVDPSVNVVAFAVRRGGKVEPIMGQGATRAADCIQAAWRELKRQHSLREQDVQEIYSEWEPSPEDLAFLERSFPASLKLSYSFERPKDGNWERAMEEVRRVISESLAKDAAVAALAPKEGFAPLPVLRNLDSLSEALVYSEVAPGLAVFLAQVGMTPRGTLGIDYVMAKAAQEQAIDVKALWAKAFSNLKDGLKVNAARHNGQTYFILTRQGNLAASAIGLPDFPAQATGWLGSARLLAAIPNPDTLMVCEAGSPVTGHLRGAVLKSTYTGAINLTPCVLRIEDGRISVLARRAAP